MSHTFAYYYQSLSWFSPSKCKGRVTQNLTQAHLKMHLGPWTSMDRLYFHSWTSPTLMLMFSVYVACLSVPVRGIPHLILLGSLNPKMGFSEFSWPGSSPFRGLDSFHLFVQLNLVCLVSQPARFATRVWSSVSTPPPSAKWPTFIGEIRRNRV